MMMAGRDYLTRTWDTGLGPRRVRHTLRTGTTVFNNVAEQTKRQRAVAQYDAQKLAEYGPLPDAPRRLSIYPQVVVDPISGERRPCP